MIDIEWTIYGLEKTMKHGIHRPLTKPDLIVIINAIEALRSYQKYLDPIIYPADKEAEEAGDPTEQKWIPR